MQISRCFAVGGVGGDERCQSDGGAISEEFGDFADAADVLCSVGGGEAQVGVEPEADVVAVEEVGGVPEVEEVLLQSDGYG
jgi:hypothetical protein